jgi:hypothetical protein
MPVILATEEDHNSKPARAKRQRDPISKKKNQKKPTGNHTGGVAQVTEHLPSKYKALSSSPRTSKRRQIPF